MAEKWTPADLKLIEERVLTGATLPEIQALLPARGPKAVRNRVFYTRELLGLVRSKSPAPSAHMLPAIDDARERQAVSRDQAHGSARLLKRMLQTGLHWIQDEALFHARWAEVRRA